MRFNLQNISKYTETSYDRFIPENLVTFFFLKDPIYLQSVIIHSANGGKCEGWHVEEYSVALRGKYYV
jgi:hypothetical protein